MDRVIYIAMLDSQYAVYIKLSCRIICRHNMYYIDASIKMKYTYLLKITLPIQSCIDRTNPTIVNTYLYVAGKYKFYNLKIRKNNVREWQGIPLPIECKRP